MNQTFSSCVDFNLIGGGECINNQFGCSDNGQCIEGKDRKFCHCMDGWMCSNCQTRIVDYVKNPSAGIRLYLLNL